MNFEISYFKSSQILADSDIFVPMLCLGNFIVKDEKQKEKKVAFSILRILGWKIFFRQSFNFGARFITFKSGKINSVARSQAGTNTDLLLKCTF